MLPVHLNLDVEADSEPDVAGDGAGNWIATWEADTGGPNSFDDIRASRSVDDGVTWSTPVTVSADPETPTWFDIHPAIATDSSGSWIIVWQTEETTGADDYAIYSVRSTNNGASWTSAQPLSPPSYLEEQIYPDIEALGDDDFIAVWAGVIEEFGDTEVLMSRSINAGASWSTPQVVNSDAASDDYDFRPTLAVSGSNVVVAWETQVGLDWDIESASSADAGETWSPSVTISTPAAGKECYPSLASDSSGTWIVTWRFACNAGPANIRSSRSVDNGATWSAPITVDPPIVSGKVAGTPDVVFSAGGVWIETWEGYHPSGSAYGTDLDVFLAVSGDGGVSWHAPIPAHVTAAADPGVSDSGPQVNLTGDGKLLIIWSSEFQNGEDIVYVRCDFLGADGDGDGISDACDNCPLVGDSTVRDFDGDELGDACDPDDDNDGVLDGSDACPDTPPGSSVYPGVYPDGCINPDADGDGICDPSVVHPQCTGFDNCRTIPNASQANIDGDNFGDVCDDSDTDGYVDAAELTCDSFWHEVLSVPERIDGGFAGVDDDLDALVDEGLLAGALGYDCDRDGYTGTAEANSMGSSVSDQDPCGGSAIPPSVPMMGWPANLSGSGSSANDVDIQDLSTFIVPMRRLNTSSGDGGYDVRWDVVPGTSGLMKVINIVDLTNVAIVTPPMLGGARAFNGPACPWPP